MPGENRQWWQAYRLTISAPPANDGGTPCTAGIGSPRRAMPAGSSGFGPYWQWSTSSGWITFGDLKPTGKFQPPRRLLSTEGGSKVRVPPSFKRSQQEILRERDFALKYLGSDGREINWAFIRCVLASVADIAIIPLQDVLGLGSEARMNLPARPGGNWRWRYAPELLTDKIRER